MKKLFFLLTGAVLLLISYLFRDMGNLNYLLIFSTPVDFFDFESIIIFQISSSFLTVAFMSMVGDNSGKAVYGTNLTEYLLVRKVVANWSNITSLITVFSAVNLLSFLMKYNSFIVWNMIIGLFLLVYLISRITSLFFNNAKLYNDILDDYNSYMDCSLFNRKDQFISEDFERMYFYTKESLYSNSFNTVKDNLAVYSKMICHGICFDRSGLSDGEVTKSRLRLKSAVMHFALLLEECKTDKLGRNDLVINAVLFFMRLYFSVRECNESSIHLLHESLGGYRNQILQNNFDIPFNKAFNFSLVHFMCEGHSDPALNHGSTEAVKYIAKTKSSSLKNRDFHDWTPLMEACEYGQYEIIEFMISMDMSDEINLKDKNNITPIETAFVNGNTDIVKLLLENNADISLVNITYRDEIEKIRLQ